VLGSQAENGAHLSADLARHQARRTTARTRVISTARIESWIPWPRATGCTVVKRMRGAAVVLANSAELSELSRDGAVDHLSGDPRVHGSTKISMPRRRRIRRAPDTACWPDRPPSGSGWRGHRIRSSIPAISPHSALASRVVASVSFVTGDSRMTMRTVTVRTSPVSSPATGAGERPSRAEYAAASRRADLSTSGCSRRRHGYTSDVIAGIEWVVANRARYIRVINLSLAIR